MLRDFEHKPTQEQLNDTLRQFELGAITEKSYIALLKFEVITPDSFMWRVLIENSVYYLYAEDYIPDLDHVKKVFNSYLQSDDWVFIEPTNSADGKIEHAIKSGYDSVFLAKSVEDADDAQFSGNAPRGFTT